MSRRKQERSKPFRIILRPLPSHEPVKTFFPDSEIFYAVWTNLMERSMRKEMESVLCCYHQTPSGVTIPKASQLVFFLPQTMFPSMKLSSQANKQHFSSMQGISNLFWIPSWWVIGEWKTKKKRLRPYQELARDFGTRPDVMFGIWWPDARKYKREHSTHWWAARLRRLMPSPNLKRGKWFWGWAQEKKKRKRSNSLSARRGTARLRMRRGGVWKRR